MSNEDLKNNVTALRESFNAAVAQARAAGITVNLWVVGQTPSSAAIMPSELALDFGNN